MFGQSNVQPNLLISYYTFTFLLKRLTSATKTDTGNCHCQDTSLSLSKTNMEKDKISLILIIFTFPFVLLFSCQMRKLSKGHQSAFKPVMIANAAAANPASLACLTRFHTQVLFNSKPVTNRLPLNINFGLILMNIIRTVCDISEICCLVVGDARSPCCVRSELNTR